MTMDITAVLTNSIGAVAVCVIFVFYLIKRGDQVDNLIRENQQKFDTALQNVAIKLETIKNDFTNYNQLIIKNFNEITKAQFEDLKRVVDENTKLTREAITVMTELKAFALVARDKPPHSQQ